MAENPALRVFGASVRTRRRELGLSQEALAARTGLHRTYIGGIERGERNVALLNICALAAALSMSVRDLLADVPVRTTTRGHGQ